MARYPVFPTQIQGGAPPSMADMGPPDLYPSSNVAPSYQRRFDRMYGRNLAGYGELDLTQHSSDRTEAEPGTALNELLVMQELDDSAGSGIFDAPGTRPNIHPDAGIFSDRMALPGYVARDRMYTPSEVVSVTTGRPVTYVNAGAVAMDDAAKIAFIENNWGNAPNPVVNWMRSRRLAPRSTANVDQNPVPPAGPAVPVLTTTPAAAATPAASGLGEFAPIVNFALGAAGVGLVVGIVYGLTRRRK